MKFSALVLLCMMAVLPLAYGLKCYNCRGGENDCGKDKVKGDSAKEMTCPAGMDKCMRVWSKPKDGDDAIVQGCADQTSCDEATKKAKGDECDGKCAVGCCDTDLCNGASPSAYSLLVIPLCSALGLILLI